MNGSDVPAIGGAERTMWVGRPSQWINFKYFFPGLMAIAAAAFAANVRPEFSPYAYALAGVIALFLFWQWLVVRSIQMVLTSQRLSVREGVLSRRKHDLELYRIKDTALEEPFLLRLVSLGNIEIVSSDRTHPRYVLRAVKNAEPLRQMLRSTVEQLRASKGVRELDME
jgi:uncharacterized membrane protein YdbT with pleckstrin-like domain